MIKAIGWQVRDCFYVVLLTFLLLNIVGRSYGDPSASLYSSVPPLLKKAADPLVMLVMSVDHQLFKKAYSDYSDLDNDGVINTTYQDSFDYSGYFDSQWCYSYSDVKGYFYPAVQASGTYKHFCTGSSPLWSGNFLNWATMSRIDILRKILFGGKRFRDVPDQTLLERAYLPRDLHAFVKVYNSTPEVPVSSLTPFNESSISLCNLAVNENGEPVVRVAVKSWPRWALAEERQCQWGHQNSPSSLFKLAEYDVYVESCVSGKDAETSSYCKRYSEGSYKPTGLLQRYGDAGNIRFGLISGSYARNSSGGLLRKNITRLVGHSDPSKDELSPENGVFNPAVKGIIHHLSTFRITKYSYTSNSYLDCNLPNISVDTFLSPPSRTIGSDRHCSNWGNPLAEMYLEALRYFANAGQPSLEYDTDFDGHFISGLSKEAWSNPQGGANACASCSIIVISSGLNSFDTDQFGQANDVPGVIDSGGVNQLTDDVGKMESAANPDIDIPGAVFADKAGGGRYCEAVNINRLSDVEGICPELPQQEGGYHIAGLAWHGRKADLRPDLDGQQFVKTYAIELAERIPSFSIDVAGKTVTFQPLCQARNSGNTCLLTEVVVNYLAEDKSHGRFLFYWEDSLFGNDHDFDASSSIEFCVGSSCAPAIGANQIKFSVRQEAKNAGTESEYSYSVTGTNNNGIVLPFAKGSGSTGDQGQGTPIATVFNAESKAAAQLPAPLWLATKYGGFSDLDKDLTPAHDFDKDGLPDKGDSREWDNRNNMTGAEGTDGIPDNYFLAQNPAQLELQIGQALQDISSRASAVANLTIVANTVKGEGTVYQSLFQPRLEHSGKTVTWGGRLHALFIDQQGWLREDSDGNGRLDDYATDTVVEIQNDGNTGQAMIQRYAVNDGVKKPAGNLQPLHDLKPLWEAREALAKLTNLRDQRFYTANASEGRHILTWLDDNHNEDIDAGEVRALIPDAFQNGGALGVAENKVVDTINYIRGEEVSGFRARTIDYDFDGLGEVWRLGDIVHSKPVVVSKPSGAYDARFNDVSYQAYKEKYRHRRQVVYVGANDGLIHAFNGGFEGETFHGYTPEGKQGETAHPLGAEIWAYAPMNLLPHLRWLTEPDYPHVYYMDGEAQAFDVNIFSPDEDHPHGWGTILVVGMGLGGGAIDMAVNDQQRSARSGYVVLDITNPEKPPVVLAEITAPSLGFATSKPALIKKRIAGTNNDWRNPLKNEWYLAFASGPGADSELAIRATINQGMTRDNLRVFIYDLQKMTFVRGFAPLVTDITGSYGGDMAAVDWNKDFKDDAAYFGTIDSSGSTLSGALYRLKLNERIEETSLNLLLNTGQPIISAPLTLIDDNDYWIYAGTGRLLINSDNKETSGNSFYGVREPTDASGLHNYSSTSVTHLINTTDIVVRASGNVQVKSSNGYTPMVIGDTEVNSFKELKKVMKQQPGWKIDLFSDGKRPSGKSLGSAGQLYSMILFSEYQPSEDSCLAEGQGYLYGLHYITGTSTPDALLGTIKSHYHADDSVALKKVESGGVHIVEPVLHAQEESKATALIQSAGGSIQMKELDYKYKSSGRQSWRQIFETQ